MLWRVIYKGKVRCIGNYLACVSFVRENFPLANKTDGHDVWWTVDNGNRVAVTIDPVVQP